MLPLGQIFVGLTFNKKEQGLKLDSANLPVAQFKLNFSWIQLVMALNFNPLFHSWSSM